MSRTKRAEFIKEYALRSPKTKPDWEQQATLKELSREVAAELGIQLSYRRRQLINPWDDIPIASWRESRYQ